MKLSVVSSFRFNYSAINLLTDSVAVIVDGGSDFIIAESDNSIDSVCFVLALSTGYSVFLAVISDTSTSFYFLNFSTRSSFAFSV